MQLYGGHHECLLDVLLAANFERVCVSVEVDDPTRPAYLAAYRAETVLIPGIYECKWRDAREVSISRHRSAAFYAELNSTTVTRAIKSMGHP